MSSRSSSKGRGGSSSSGAGRGSSSTSSKFGQNNKNGNSSYNNNSKNNKSQSSFTKGKPSSTIKRTTNNGKPTQQRRNNNLSSKSTPKMMDGDDFFEVDGDYDFSSDVDVMDLSAMLDSPEERISQIRKGGANKQLKPGKKETQKAPASKGKKSYNNDDDEDNGMGDEEDEEIDSDNDIFSLEDYLSKPVEEDNGPKSISRDDKKKAPIQQEVESEEEDEEDEEDDSIEAEDFEVDEDDEMEMDEDFEMEDDDDDDEDDEVPKKKSGALSKLFGNGSDSDDDTSDDDDEDDEGEYDPLNPKKSAFAEYLARYDQKKASEPTGPTKLQQLRELTKTTRRKGELFSNEEQIGDVTTSATIANLQGAVNRDENSNTNAMFSLGSTNNTGALSVSSLLATLKSPGLSTTTGTNSMLASLKAPSLRKLSQQTEFVVDKQEKALQSRVGDVERGRMERNQLYGDRAREISKFQGIVQHNRGVQTLDLTKQQKPEKVGVATVGALVDQFTVTNELEEDLDSILEMVGRDQIQRSKLEKEKQLAGLYRGGTMEEMEEKHKYLSKMKLAAFFEQQRAARIAKVKSRAQRKYLRLQEEKTKRRQLEDGIAGKAGGMTPEQLEELELQFEKQRIKERALLSHKNTSQWAKRTLRLSAKDKSARTALQEQLTLGQQLRQKLGHTKDQDGFEYDGDNSDIHSDDDDDTVVRKQLDRLTSKPTGEVEDKKSKGSALLNLPFMKRAEEELKRKNDEKLAQMRKDLAMEDEYNSDDEEYHLNKGKKVDVNSAEYKSAIQSKASALKKSYGPGANSATSGPSHSLPGNVAEMYENETVSAVAAPSTLNTGKMSSMFGGLFDLDDNDLVQLGATTNTSTQSTTTGALSLVAQQEQREKILQSMRAAAGKEPLAPKQPQQNTQTIATAADSTDDDDDDDDDNVKSSNKKITMNNDSDDDDDDNSDDDAANPWMTTPKDKGSDDDDDDDDDEEEVNPWLVQAQPTTTKKSKNKASLANTNDGIALDLSESLLLADVAPKKASGAKEAKKTAKSNKELKQTDLVSLAFTSANDQNEDFERLKLQEMEHDLPSLDSSNSVAGWGSWAGVEKNQKQLQKEQEIKDKKLAKIKEQRDAIMAARTDAHLSNVIVNQKADLKSLKYQMNKVPYGFSSVNEYKSSLRVPLGREWNTAQGFKGLNKPDMIVNTGQVVQAMKWNKSFEQYANNGDVKANKESRLGQSEGEYDGSKLPEDVKPKGAQVRKSPSSSSKGDKNKAGSKKVAVKRQKTRQ